ncbi:osmotically-inducible protein OsmY [Haemophilus paracuniculus]|uniref:Osmotically-inducible protein OsmY n=1 Tax=Haemophilus paracuniculus TaxID=734 RepID=A0A1T0ATL6_9PAST|nr:division/outer membrane stress-associated lipid-binding lipoprotein [Haemophilus paracuniculus]OOR99969.1 osmotically-inducible protein OsmY [Haemophilus paracuniculus]
MKTLIKRLSMFAVLGVSVISLSGCIATAVVTTAAVATKVATDPRSAGTQIDDETLEEKVAYNLNKDAQLQQEARINVVSYSGRILLVGQAPSDAAKEAAGNIASGVDGVKEVYNEIRVTENAGVAQIATDSWITTKIKSKLLVNGDVKSTDVKVITENGEVFLMGNLTASQTNAATEVARNVNGVKKVVKVISYLR